MFHTLLGHHLGPALMVEKGRYSSSPPLFEVYANDSGRVELHPGDYVTISASRYPFANVMPPVTSGEDWIGSISRTLNWNSRQKQKSFKEWEEQTLDDKLKSPKQGL